MRPSSAAGVLSFLLVVGAASPARAQAEAPVGVRAAGMGGAFTAVADDGSAVFWNPAGLATGSFFSLILDRNALDNRSATLIALGTPPLGVSYYRTATGELADGRSSLVTHHAGATLVQSVGVRMAVGATVKVVRGVVSAAGSAVSTNKVDADIGVMVTGALGRLGLSVRNLTEPDFQAPGGNRVELERRVRTGLSLNVARRLVAAADFDLTAADTARGEWREAAVGLEANPGRKTWLRTGIHWNTASGPTAPVGSVGGSYAVYGSTVADAQISFGSADGDRGWGVGLR